MYEKVRKPVLDYEPHIAKIEIVFYYFFFSQWKSWKSALPQLELVDMEESRAEWSESGSATPKESFLFCRS
jgi:hypothetical protein